MSVTAGALSQVSVGPTTASLLSAAASGGSGPYTYQWYRSTTSGFSPGGGNIIAGATALTLDDTDLIPGTTYYYVVRATDTGDSNATDDSAELAVVTSAPVQSPNQFQQAPYVGQLSLPFNMNTVACQVDASQGSTPLYSGQAVKIVDSAGGVPKVIACDADDDEALGFVNFNFKNVSFAVGQALEVSLAGNCMYLYATEAFARGVQLTMDTATRGGVRGAAGNTGDTIIGWAFDKATAAGQLVRVMISTPSFTVV